MIVKASVDAGVEGEIAILNALKGISVKVEDPDLGEPFEVNIIGADWPEPNAENADGENIYGPDLYGHPYEPRVDYLWDEAVTLQLSDKAVITYL